MHQSNTCAVNASPALKGRHRDHSRFFLGRHIGKVFHASIFHTLLIRFQGCYDPFSMLATKAAQLKLAAGAPSITTLLGLVEVMTQFENLILLKAQSVPFFSHTAMSKGVPFRASSVRSA